jgi:sulfur-oxidizing protein SoxA
MTRLPGAAVLVAGLALAATAASGADERRSGFSFMSPETQAMQSDDAANPGMLFVLDGETLWQAKAGTAGRSCADCHGDARQSMRGVAARYPAFDPARGGPIDLEERIALCRRDRQGVAAAPLESRETLALAAFVAHQSRGVPIAAGKDERLAPALARGRELYERRQGQLNFSCAQCHEDRWGKRLGSAPIPQALPTGYPIYRLEWQDLGSLRRRLRNCLTGMRAEPFPDGAPEIVDLELYLMEKARGLPMETPAVRP